MNTAKKRILSLTLTICLALSMMLTLSACGKKNLEEYFNTDTMQKLLPLSSTNPRGWSSKCTPRATSCTTTSP
jgi:hypothetical protein